VPAKTLSLFLFDRVTAPSGTPSCRKESGPGGSTSAADSGAAPQRGRISSRIEPVTVNSGEERPVERDDKRWMTETQPRLAERFRRRSGIF